MKKAIVLLVLLGVIYIFVEVTNTAITNSIIGKTFALIGHSSLWMFLIGGAMGILLGAFNQVNLIRKNLNVFFQCLAGAFLITLVELLSGLILNKALGFGLWDYSNLPLNFMGQICLPMSIAWFFFCPFVFWIDDILRFFIYKEGQYYSLWAVYKDLFILWKKTSYQTTL